MSKQTVKATEIDADGYVTLSNGGTGESTKPAEWVGAGKGVTVEGTIEKAFIVTDNGDRRVAYTIRDSKGDLWNVGERQQMRTLRQEKIGSGVLIKFNFKEDIGNGREQWDVTVKSKKDGTGRKVIDILKAENERLNNDLPF